MKKLLTFIVLAMFAAALFSSCRTSHNCNSSDNVSKYQKEVKY